MPHRWAVLVPLEPDLAFLSPAIGDDLSAWPPSDGRRAVSRSGGATCVGSNFLLNLARLGSRNPRRSDRVGRKDCSSADTESAGHALFVTNHLTIASRPGASELVAELYPPHPSSRFTVVVAFSGPSFRVNTARGEPPLRPAATRYRGRGRLRRWRSARRSEPPGM